MKLYLWTNPGFLIPSLHHLFYFSQFLALGLRTQRRIFKGNTYLECFNKHCCPKSGDRGALQTASGRQAWASAGVLTTWKKVLSGVHTHCRQRGVKERRELCVCIKWTSSLCLYQRTQSSFGEMWVKRRERDQEWYSNMVSYLEKNREIGTKADSCPHW